MPPSSSLKSLVNRMEAEQALVLQEVKAGQQEALDAAEEAIAGGQRELQEERERSTRLMEAAQAGQLSVQSPGTLPLSCQTRTFLAQWC